MENYANGSDIPMGLGMALAQNVEAMKYFSALSKEEQKRIIEHTHVIRSKEEMQSYVQSLVSTNEVSGSFRTSFR